MVLARDWALAALLFACGKPPPAKPVVAVAKPTVGCADAARVIDAPDQLPTRIESIQSACERGAWSAPCIVAGGDWKTRCLTDAQREELDAAIVAWAEGDVPDDDDAGMIGREPYLACEDAIHDTNLWEPAPVHDIELLATMRKRVLVQACNADEWDQDVRTCLAKASERDATNSCAAKLPPDKLQHAGAGLARVDDLVDRTVKGQARPPACAAIVAKHYGDAAWKGKLGDLEPVERSKLIARSRAQLLAACGTWDAQRKACMFAGGDRDCYAEGYDWTFPAVGVLPSSTSVAACDRYVSTIASFENCAKIPAASRDQMREAMATVLETFANLRTLPEDQRQAMAESCKYGAEALQSVIQQMGC